LSSSLSSPSTTELPRSGVYVIELDLAQSLTTQVGALGTLSFAGGLYWYVGSAMRGLPHRIARHTRRSKTHRWHIDALSIRATVARAWVLPARKELECRLARSLAETEIVVPRFGASDCRCAGHLFRLVSDPDRLARDLELGPAIALEAPAEEG
jgi:sugar fermentation stimulation protein A